MEYQLNPRPLTISFVPVSMKMCEIACKQMKPAEVKQLKFPEFFTVADVAKITGLSERTIRNYLEDGRLKGKKVGVQWRFTRENIENLFMAPKVSDSMANARREMVLDFLEHKSKARPRLCFIYDIPCQTEEEATHLCEPILDKVNAIKSEGELRFSFQEHGGVARLILMGEPRLVQKVLALLTELSVWGETP